MDESLWERKARFAELKKIAEKDPGMSRGVPPKKANDAPETVTKPTHTEQRPPSGAYGWRTVSPEELETRQTDSTKPSERGDASPQPQAKKVGLAPDDGLEVEEALAQERAAKEKQARPKPNPFQRLKQAVLRKESEEPKTANQISAPYGVKGITKVERPDIKDAIVKRNQYEQQLSALEERIKTGPGMENRLNANNGRELRTPLKKN